MKYFYSIVLFIAIASCQKEQTGTVPEPTKSTYEKLIGTWKFVSFKEGNMYLTNADPCLADNLMVFKADTTVYLSQGVCLDEPTEEKEDDLGKWASGSENIIKFRGNNVKIFKLNDTAFWFGGDGAVPFEYRWKR
jgi:hypothetical protein